MVFPDPSGELLQNLENAYFVNYLGQSRAIMLMVDPFSSDKARAANKDRLELVDADKPLQVLVDALRNELNRKDDKPLSKQLAVVVTKCDEKGVIDIDEEYRLGRKGKRQQLGEQGRYYRPELAQEISQRVRQHLEDDLEMHNVIQLAESNFREVHYFAASAIGAPPLIKKKADGSLLQVLNNPTPRRVEEPLLWILHRWGFL
jgi:hypothetical protein